MLYKRGAVWHIKFKWGGQTIRCSSGTDSKTLARKIETEIRHKLATGKWFERDPAKTTRFQEVWEKYMREEAKYKAPGTYDRAGQCAKNFLPVIGNLTLSEITPSALSSYKAKRLEENVKPSTVVKELSFIRRVFSLCKREWQLCKQSPFEVFKMPQVNDQRVRFLKPGEFEKLITSCPSWLKPIAILSLFTGMRRSNVVLLQWHQIDFTSQVIHIDYTKNGQRLTIPLSNAAYALLCEMKRSKVVHLGCPYVFHDNGISYNLNRVSMAFKRASRRAGIEDFRFHDQRHDVASRLVQNGHSLYVVQTLLGQKDGRMTQRYAHLEVENLRKAVNSIEDSIRGGHKRGHSESKEGATVTVTP